MGERGGDSRAVCRHGEVVYFIQGGFGANKERFERSLRNLLPFPFKKNYVPLNFIKNVKT